MLKKFPKILISIFLIIFAVQLLAGLFLFLAPKPINAVDFTPQVGIDDTFKQKTPYKMTNSTKPIAEYIRAIYKYAIGIVGIVAVVVMMLGGFLWITAGGNSTQIESAKSWIGASLTGLVLVLFSYAILKTINPALVDLKTTTIKTIEEIKTTAGDSPLKDGGKACCKKPEDCGGEGYTCDTLLITNYCNGGTCVKIGGLSEDDTPCSKTSECKNGLECTFKAGAGRCRPPDWDKDALNPGDPCGNNSQEGYVCMTGSVMCPSGSTWFGSNKGAGWEGRSCVSGLLCCKKD